MSPVIPIALNASVRLVALRFRFASFEALPSPLRFLIRDAKENKAQYAPTGGIMTIEPTPQCSLAGLREALESAEYQLVGVTCEEQQNTGDRTGKTVHYIAVFTFAHNQVAAIYDRTFWEMREELRALLTNICESAYWRVRTYLNPFYANGREVPGEHAVSVNLEVRQPLLGPSGTPITEWEKDAEGNRVGEAAKPLAPKSAVHIVGSTLTLV